MPSRQSPMANLSTASLLMLAALAPFGPAQASPASTHLNATQVAAYDTFTLHSEANGQCLSYYPGSDGTSKKTFVSECQQYKNEQCWFFDGAGLQMKSTINSYCLTVCEGDDCHDYRQRQMSEVVVVPCEKGNSPAQSWVANDGEFMSELNGHCLTQCTTCFDFVVVTYPCMGISEQHWRQLPTAEAAVV